MEILVLPDQPSGLGSGGTGLLAGLGTGTSVPGGVEAVFEYNGLVMNIRNWLDTYLITSVEGLADADLRDSREVNPGDHGETFFNSFYGGRTITLGGKIRAHNLAKMRDMIQALRTAFSGTQSELPLRITGGSASLDVIINCKKFQSLNIPEAQNNFQFERDFQVFLRASNPRFQSYTELFTVLTAGASYPLSVVVPNLGNYNAQPKIQIVGPVTNPVITNTTTGKSMSMTVAIASGNTWTIDVGRRSIVDQAGVNQFGVLDVTSDWIELAPGNNNIQLTGTGSPTAGTTRLLIFSRDVWI